MMPASSSWRHAANDLGNHLNRALSMVNRYFDGHVPLSEGPEAPVDDVLREAAGQTFADLDSALKGH
jgi:methionyl-tRNA synthetase